MHLNVASVKISDVLLLDEADENGGDRLFTDRYNVNFTKSVLDFHHFRIYFVSSAWLQGSIRALTSLIVISILVITTVSAHKWHHSDLVLLQIVPLCRFDELDVTGDLSIDFAQVGVSVGAGG